MQKHTVNGTPTAADQQCDRRSGPATTNKVIYADINRSMLRTIPMPLEGHQWAAALGALILPIRPSKAPKPLDPLAIYGVCYAGPNQFTFGTPGAGHTMAAREVR